MKRTFQEIYHKISPDFTWCDATYEALVYLKDHNIYKEIDFSAFSSDISKTMEEVYTFALSASGAELTEEMTFYIRFMAYGGVDLVGQWMKRSCPDIEKFHKQICDCAHPEYVKALESAHLFSNRKNSMRP